VGDFSKRGGSPTQFERDLVAQQNTSRIGDLRQVWVSLAKRIGLDALFVVFDELGAEQVHVPKREDFVEAIWRPLRDAQILARIAAGETPEQLAREYGITARMIRKLRAGNPAGASSAKKC
jgi:hypothetical protein